MSLQPSTIQTDRLLLRLFRQSDQENVFQGLSHPEVIKYYGVSFSSLEATQEQMDWYRDHEQNGTGQWFAICSPDDKLFYGAIGLNDVKKEHRKGELGFWLLPDYWGKGIITEAMPAVCDYAFNQMNLHRIEAFVETKNRNSQKVLEKWGFAHEGTMQECEIKNGEFISIDIFAKLRG